MDINCDLGEGEPPARTRALCRHVTSANIACGGHAGDADSMRRCLRICRELGVRAGAHPGFCDRKNFGRKALPISPSELETLLSHQIGAFALLAAGEQTQMTHVKLHGALYHAVDADPALSWTFVLFLKRYFPRVAIYTPPAGHTARAAQKYGVDCLGEIFAERGYAKNGRLLARGKPGAVLTSLPAIRARMRLFTASGALPAEGGGIFKTDAGTVCVHSDTPGAVKIARLLREFFPQPEKPGTPPAL